MAYRTGRVISSRRNVKNRRAHEGRHGRLVTPRRWSTSYRLGTKSKVGYDGEAHTRALVSNCSAHRAARTGIMIHNEARASPRARFAVSRRRRRAALRVAPPPLERAPAPIGRRVGAPPRFRDVLGRYSPAGGHYGVRGAFRLAVLAHPGSPGGHLRARSRSPGARLRASHAFARTIGGFSLGLPADTRLPGKSRKRFSSTSELLFARRSLEAVRTLLSPGRTFFHQISNEF